MTQHTFLASLEAMIRDADHAECAALIGELEKIKALAYTRLMQKSEPGKENLLDPQQVAVRLNVPDSFVYEAARQRKLKTVKLGKYVRFTETAVREYQEKYGS